MADKIFYDGNCFNNKLYDDSRYKKLLSRINKIRILTDEGKNFLSIAATRFININYDTVAEYYLNCDNEEVKELLEDLYLIIFDKNEKLSKAYKNLEDSVDNIFHLNKDKVEEEYTKNESNVNNGLVKENYKKYSPNSRSSDNSFDNNIVQRVYSGAVKVAQYDLDGNLIQTFNTLKEANLSLGRAPKNEAISNSFKTGKPVDNYYWKKVND